MKVTIVDASVAIKWFRADDEPDRAAALRCLERIRDGQTRAIVPELFFCEMLAVLCRLSGSRKKTDEAMLLLEALGLERLAHGRELLCTAAALAHESGVSGYDALYVATATLTGGTWLTADERAVRRLGGHAHVAHLRAA